MKGKVDRASRGGLSMGQDPLEILSNHTYAPSLQSLDISDESLENPELRKDPLACRVDCSECFECPSLKSSNSSERHLWTHTANAHVTSSLYHEAG